MTDLIALSLPTLMRDEGKRLKPYRCTAGVLTIGYGTNIDDGITDDEAMFLLESRLSTCIADCQRAFPWLTTLTPARQSVLVQMRYQLGMSRLLGFRKMLAALARGDHATAADEMLDSLWARQTPKRAQRHARVMRIGTVS